MNALTRIMHCALPQWVRRRQHAAPDLPRAALRVTDEHDELLAQFAAATRTDYRLQVELPSGPAFVDLYPHYLMFVSAGGKAAYHGFDHACYTYVKFGACIQDRRALHILIQPATEKEVS